MASIVKWVKKNVVSRYMMKGCPDEVNCLEILELVLDKEADEEQVKNYFNHMEGCWTCFQNYNLETSIRELIKTKTEKKDVPDALVQKIKAQIDNIETDLE